MKFDPNFKQRGTPTAVGGVGRKRYAFPDYMSLRGTGAGEGHHLRPKVPLPRGSPLAGEHNPGCSRLYRKSFVYPMTSRGPRCVSCNMREIPSKDGISRIPAPTQSRWGPRKQRSKRALGREAVLPGFAVLFTDLLYSREAELSVSSLLHRDRVMEARFDCGIIRLPNRARAIDSVMFSREAWVVRSMLNSSACCSRYHMAKGPPREGPSA